MPQRSTKAHKLICAFCASLWLSTFVLLRGAYWLGGAVVDPLSIFSPSFTIHKPELISLK